MRAEPLREDTQFTADELLTICETLEIVLQTDGFVDATSGGASSAEEIAQLLTGVAHTLSKARTLRSRVTTGCPTAPRPADDLPVSGIQLEDIYGPDEQQAAVDYLTGCGFDVLDRNWQGSDGRLDIVATERHAFVVFDVRRPHARFHRPLHQITHVRQWQLRLLAAAWLSAHGRRFDQIRIDAIALTWSNSNGYTIEHVRGVGP